MKIVVLKPPGFRKLSHSSEMRNDVLMHRESLKGEGLMKQPIQAASTFVCTVMQSRKALTSYLESKTVQPLDILRQYSSER